MANEEIMETMGFLERLFVAERPKALLAFAKKRGLTTGRIMAADGEYYIAAKYAMQLYCYADMIGQPDEALSESYQVLSLLLTLERIKQDTWGYGEKLHFDLTQEGITITRVELFAFAAQNGNWKSNRQKKTLMVGNQMALAFHGADLLTRMVSLPGVDAIPGTEIPAALSEKFNACWGISIQESMESLARSFIPAYIRKEGAAERVEQMLTRLRTLGDFYIAPVSERDRLPQGLANHVCNTILWLTQIMRPQTEAQVGRIVLCGILHKLYLSVNFTPVYKTVKRYCPEGDRSEPNGRKFVMETVVQYEENDRIPIGPGLKTLHMALD